jgi:predicted dehydrogenase
MVGETSYYYPCAIYCRERYQKGDFGDIVYAEGEYYHDWDHGLYDVMKWRGGEHWQQFAGGPPMFYPTHSMSMIVSVTGAYATQVSCFGFVDHHEDGLYQAEANIWGNVYSNQSALMKMSDGSVTRLNEFRRIGHPGTVGVSMYGTRGSYEEQSNAQAWVTKNRSELADLTELLAPVGVPVTAGGDMDKVTSADGTHAGVSRVHDVSRLPREFIGLPNGHLGSHQFLVDDFVRACVTGQQPPCNVWQAARYLVPGLIANDSCQQGGVLLDVPDFGSGPF